MSYINLSVITNLRNAKACKYHLETGQTNEIINAILYRHDCDARNIITVQFATMQEVPICTKKFSFSAG